MNKYFYIIKKDGGIIEVPYDLVVYKKATAEKIKGGNLIIKPMGYDVPQTISAYKIEEIIPEDIYLSQMRSSRRKEYLYNGQWVDNTDRSGRINGQEPWRKEHDKKLLQSKNREQTPEERQRAVEAREKVSQELKAQGII